MQKLPLTAIQVIDKIIPIVNYVMQHQIRIRIYFFFASFVTLRSPGLNAITDNIFWVAVLPWSISVYLSRTIPGFIRSKIWNTTESLGNSVQDSYNLSNNYHLQTGGHQARDIWLQTLDIQAADVVGA